MDRVSSERLERAATNCHRLYDHVPYAEVPLEALLAWDLENCRAERDALKEDAAQREVRVKSLEVEARCPDCGCCTPEDADAAECGCDAPVCMREGTLAECVVDLTTERDALKEQLAVSHKNRTAESVHYASLCAEIIEACGADGGTAVAACASVRAERDRLRALLVRARGVLGPGNVFAVGQAVNELLADIDAALGEEAGERQAESGARSSMVEAARAQDSAPASSATVAGSSPAEPTPAPSPVQEMIQAHWYLTDADLQRLAAIAAAEGRKIGCVDAISGSLVTDEEIAARAVEGWREERK